MVNKHMFGSKTITDKEINTPFIIFLTGSSGAGKTTLLQTLQHQYAEDNVAYLYFDSIGVPSYEEMVRLYGSGEEWQKAMTQRWIQKITSDYYDKTTVIIEGQVRPAFIIESFAKSKHSNYKIVLIHCDKTRRNLRLAKERNQPELITEEMENWTRYLKDQAESLNLPVIDTSNLTPMEAIDALHNSILSKG